MANSVKRKPKRRRVVRRRKFCLPSWTPWALTALSLVAGVLFNIYDRAIEKAKWTTTVMTKLDTFQQSIEDVKQMIEQVDDQADQLTQYIMDEAREKK